MSHHGDEDNHCLHDPCLGSQGDAGDDGMNRKDQHEHIGVERARFSGSAGRDGCLMMPAHQDLFQEQDRQEPGGTGQGEPGVVGITLQRPETLLGIRQQVNQSGAQEYAAGHGISQREEQIAMRTARKLS